ncbi:hypothetical protein WMF04_12190 [Sorangium sp. So ce260]
MIGRVTGAALLAMLAAGSLTLAACGRSDDGESGGKELRVWHYEAPESGMGVAWNEAIKEFEATDPGVKVKLEQKGFEQIQKTAPLQLPRRIESKQCAIEVYVSSIHVNELSGDVRGFL